MGGVIQIHVFFFCYDDCFWGLLWCVRELVLGCLVEHQ